VVVHPEQRSKKSGQESHVEEKPAEESAETEQTDTTGEFMRSTMLDMNTRLRVATAVEKNETLASQKVFEILKRRGHPDAPPPTISDGWGGIDQAMIAVYGLVPEYGGRGRPPTQKKPGKDWLYLQMVKQHNERGHFTGIKLQAVFGNKEELIQLMGESTAYIERNNLTSRMFNGRQVRKTLAFSKEVANHRASAIWEDTYYNLVKYHKSLRVRVYDCPGRKWKPRTPMMAAGLSKHAWTIKEVLTAIPLKC
jgi:hypothetical protein